jgi:hypothetical protein
MYWKFPESLGFIGFVLNNPRVLFLKRKQMRLPNRHSGASPGRGARLAASSFVAELSLFRCERRRTVLLFGEWGLATQLGNVSYSRPRKFREKLEKWLDLVRVLWPECPGHISGDGSALIVAPASAILSGRGEYA